MATSKTLTPTNVTIQIPAFADKPDQRANSNCIDKEADAINALSDHIATKVYDLVSGSITRVISGNVVMVNFNNASLSADGIDIGVTVASSVFYATMPLGGFVRNAGSVLIYKNGEATSSLYGTWIGIMA